MWDQEVSEVPPHRVPGCLVTMYATDAERKRSPRRATGLCGEQYLDTRGSFRDPSGFRLQQAPVRGAFSWNWGSMLSRLQRPMRISVRTGLRVGDLQEDRRPTICSRCPEDPERGCNIKEAIPVLAMSGRPRRGTIRRGRCRRAAAVLVRTLQVVVVVAVEMDVDGPTRRGPAIAVLCGIPGTARLMGGALEIEYCREVICGWSCDGGWARRHWCDTRQRVNRRGPTPGQFDVTGSGRV